VPRRGRRGPCCRRRWRRCAPSPPRWSFPRAA